MEKIINKKTIYNGKILTLELRDIIVNNEIPAKREIILHSTGVSIVADDGKNIYLVKQYRSAVEKEVLEIPAGLVEAGEDPLLAAKRELQEEIGYDSNDIELLTKFYPSPGFSNEITYIYYAKNLFKSSLPKDEDEFIKVEKLPIYKIDEFINSTEIIDAKTILGLTLFKLKK